MTNNETGRPHADTPQRAGQVMGGGLHSCTICGKALTTKDSIARGIGPECDERTHHGGHTRAELAAAVALAEKKLNTADDGERTTK